MLSILLFIFTLTSYASRDPLQYKLVFEGKEKMISCVKNESGVLLLPLKEVVGFVGFTDEECGRCGKDEVYPADNTKPLEKGHVYVNWLKNVITFSNDTAVVVLDANNERIDGRITYTSMQFYQYIGFKAELSESQRTITMTAQNAGGKEAVKQTETPQGSVTDGPQGFVADKITYAYDPSCSSCKKITALLETLSKQYGISLEKISTSATDSKNQLKKYYEKCSVPGELKGIYPMLFIGERYLFDQEITSSNIESLLKGNNIEHTLKHAALAGKMDIRFVFVLIPLFILLLLVYIKIKKRRA